MNSPWCVPVTLTRATVLSPSAIRSSTFIRMSGNASRRVRKNSSVPSFVAGKPWPALVLDEVVRDQVAEPGDVSRVDPLVGVPHRRSVVHGRPPILSWLQPA